MYLKKNVFLETIQTYLENLLDPFKYVCVGGLKITFARSLHYCIKFYITHADTQAVLNINNWNFLGLSNFLF